MKNKDKQYQAFYRGKPIGKPVAWADMWNLRHCISVTWKAI